MSKRKKIVLISVLFFIALLSVASCNPAPREEIPPAFDNLAKVEAAYYFTQAMDATKDRRFEDAIQYYEKALELNPNDAATYYNMAITYDEYLDNPSKAIFCYNKYIELAPDAADREKVMKWIGNCQERQEEKK